MLKDSTRGPVVYPFPHDQNENADVQLASQHADMQVLLINSGGSSRAAEFVGGCRFKNYPLHATMNVLNRFDEESPMTDPKVTKEQVLSWCPEPRGDQDPGNHHEVPAMRYENASSSPGKEAENRELGRQLIATFEAYKPGDRFVLQWRMFPNADSADEPHDGCGCSCGCG